MKALLLEGSKNLSLKNIDSPKLSKGHVLVSVQATSIGGSEYLAYSDPGIRPLPNIMGHGFAGIANGRRVVINPVQGCNNCVYCHSDFHQLCDSWSLIGVQSDGGFAELVSVPEDSVVELPDYISWEQAVFVEPFANSLNAWEMSGATNGSSIAIIGAGSLGLGLVASANKAGCIDVSISEPSRNRFAAANHLGAKNVDGNKLYDIVFDTVGSTEARKTAIELCAKTGTIVLLGFASSLLEANAGQIIRAQKRIIGSFAYSYVQFKRSIALTKQVRSDWVKNISFQDVEGILNDYLNGDFSVIKAALRPAPYFKHENN